MIVLDQVALDSGASPVGCLYFLAVSLVASLYEARHRRQAGAFSAPLPRPRGTAWAPGGPCRYQGCPPPTPPFLAWGVGVAVFLRQPPGVPRLVGWFIRWDRTDRRRESVMARGCAGDSKERKGRVRSRAGPGTTCSTLTPSTSCTSAAGLPGQVTSRRGQWVSRSGAYFRPFGVGWFRQVCVSVPAGHSGGGAPRRGW